MGASRLAALALFVASAAAGEEAVTVEATGEAAIVKGDEARALEEAVKSALRAAVEQVAGVSIEGQTHTLDHVLVRDQVIARTSGYVRKHELLSRKADKGVLTVKVKAEVGKGELAKDVEAARALVKRFGRPSIVIVLQEQTAHIEEGGKVTGATSSEVTAAVLTEAFKGDGWEIKDPAVLQGSLKLAPGVQLGDGHLKEVGDLTRANYVLYGKTVLRYLRPAKGLGMHSASGEQLLFPVSGEYDLALAATDTGTQLAKLAGKLDLQGPSSGKRELVGAATSYERTAYDLVRRRAAEITGPVRAAALESFRARELNGHELAVSASGLGTFAGARELEAVLEAIPGVREVEHLDFKGGVGSYRVTFRGSSADFADAAGKASFKKKKLEVKEVSGNKVGLALGR